MSKEVYVINHCNAWHEYSSFRLIGVVEEEHLEKALRKIKKAQGYTEEEMEQFIDVSCIILNELDI